MVRRLPTPPEEPIRPGGHHGSISIRRYWDLNAEIEAGAQNQIEDEGDAVAALGEVLGKAVQRQMISDVPLGAFLSGGVDSSRHRGVDAGAKRTPSADLHDRV